MPMVEVSNGGTDYEGIGKFNNVTRLININGAYFQGDAPLIPDRYTGANHAFLFVSSTTSLVRDRGYIGWGGFSNNRAAYTYHGIYCIDADTNEIVFTTPWVPSANTSASMPFYFEADKNRNVRFAYAINGGIQQITAHFSLYECS